ncbi:MAG: carboxypeptidase regulatory-like domain-containing protein [Deltaproteobacteria bacterium]|nr:MAG: carboxypeptidase regulatory-like domain-containing protein [Deltaproteobacteria bacterium]
MGRGSVVAAAALAAALAVACGSSNQGEGPPDSGPAPECTTNADCDDGNDCSFDWCDQGSCAHEPDDQLEGEPCDDGDACTTNNTCQNGVCTGDPVDCSGLSGACATGVCDPATGECVAQPVADDTPCDDATFCTTGDVCVAGECVGQARDCSELDSACTQGVCDEQTAACVAMPINEGGACDDGLFCTTGDQCLAGQCAGQPRDCSTASDQCNVGTCDEDADACVPTPMADGTPCNDGLFCTTSDQCVAGTCTGGATVDCSALTDQCNVGTCDEDADACAKAPANEGSACDDGLFCTTGETCAAGVCSGGAARSCDDGDACTADTCDEGADACVSTPVPPIPNAEGPPGDATCSDGIDNDCDGAADLADASCVGCTLDSDCDDGNPCTTDTCGPSLLCENTPVADGTACDDGLFCTVGDACTGGACAGGSPRDCSALDDPCNRGSCSESADACVQTPTNEGGPCDDGLFCTVGDACSSGACTGSPRDCSPVAGACQAASCDEAGDACVATNLPDGTACDVAFCTVGQTCSGGVCGGGAPRPCSDGNACTSDACDEVADTCVNTALALDPASPVFTSASSTSVCLVAGSGARVVVWTQLADTAGAPVSGASVTIGGIAATESAVSAGSYYVEYVAGATPGAQTLSVVATACGDTVTLAQTVDVTVASPNATSGGGLGGCSPMGGNLRVRAVDESGAPIAGASVLVGDAEATRFETNPEALFGGGSTLASTVATTDANGYATFFDYAGGLSGPIAVTAGATGRSYVTVVGGDASDVVLELPLIHPPQPSTSLYSDGRGMPTPPDCGDVDAAVVLPHLDIDVIGTFETSLLFEPNRCWDPGNNLVSSTPVALPQNVWLPAQGAGGLFVCGASQFDEAPWSLRLKNTADTGVREDVVMVAADATLQDVQSILGGGSIADILPVLDYNNLGFLLDVNVAGDVSPNTINLQFSYPNPVTLTFAGAPVETDIVGISGGDYDGTNGVGPLMLMGTDVRPFTSSGNQVTLPNADFGSMDPMGVRRVAALVALYLDDADSNHTSAIAGREDGVSTIYVRDDGANPANAPYTASGGTFNLSTDFGLSPFLNIPLVTFSDPGHFEWSNATNGGNVPVFSRHDLTVVTETYLPVLSCATENEVRESRTTHWIVYKPFGLDCGASECFTLPTLPASFPRATPGPQQRAGLEPIVGSGAACSGACPVAGETCVDPDGAGGAATAMCMGGSGTASDPYTVQRYEWVAHVYSMQILTRTTPFDFDDFDFADRRLYMTHEATNRAPLP